MFGERISIRNNSDAFNVFPQKLIGELCETCISMKSLNIQKEFCHSLFYWLLSDSARNQTMKNTCRDVSLDKL